MQSTTKKKAQSIIPKGQISKHSEKFEVLSSSHGKIPCNVESLDLQQCVKVEPRMPSLARHSVEIGTKRANV